MEPINSFLISNECCQATRNTSAKNSNTPDAELRDAHPKLHEQHNRDEGQYQEFTDDTSAVASEASDSSHSYFDYAANGLVDSLTLIDCRRLLLELSDESDSVEEFQEEDVNTRIPSNNKRKTSRRHGHNRSGVRRACNEDTQDTMYVYIVPTKMG
jgi:hypothetical protein